MFEVLPVMSFFLLLLCILPFPLLLERGRFVLVCRRSVRRPVRLFFLLILCRIRYLLGRFRFEYCVMLFLMNPVFVSFPNSGVGRMGCSRRGLVEGMRGLRTVLLLGLLRARRSRFGRLFPRRRRCFRMVFCLGRVLGFSFC